MTPNLIELIVQALMNGNVLEEYYLPASDTHQVAIDRDKLRKCLASIPEMPQVDLEEVEKLVQYRYEEAKFSYENGEYKIKDSEIFCERLRKKIGYTLTDLEHFKKQKR